VIRYTPLLMLALLAACDEAAMAELNASLSGTPVASAPEVPQLPAAVLAALPPGVPPAVVFQDSSGCYAVGIEVTVPQQGYPLRDAAGQPICEGQPALVALAPPAATAQ